MFVRGLVSLTLLAAPLLAGDPLAAALTDGDAPARLEAAKRLVASGRDRAEIARILIGAIRKQTDKKTRRAMAENIAVLGPRALPALLENLHRDDWCGGEIRRALLTIGEEGIAGVAGRLPSRHAIRMLKAMGPAAAAHADGLGDVIAGPRAKPDVELEAMLALAHVAPGHAALHAAVRRYLRHDKAWNRARGCDCVVAMAAAARPFVPVLLELLDDADSMVRRGVALSLPAIGHIDAVVFRAVTRRIDEGPDANLFAMTVDLLARDRKRAVPFALRMIRKPYDRERHGIARRAVELLARFGLSSTPHLLFALQRGREAHGAAREALLRLGPPAIPQIVAAARAGNRLAIRTLAMPGGREAVPFLISRVVALAPSAHRFGRPRSRAYVRTPIEGELADVAFALTRIGPSALAALQRLTVHENPAVRRTAAAIADQMCGLRSRGG